MDDTERRAAWDRLLRLLGVGWARDLEALNGLSHREWTNLLALADRHWVTPLLHRRLTSGAAGVPNDVRSHDIRPRDVQIGFRRRYLRSAFRHVRFAATVAPVLAACRTAGIDVVMLKGGHLGPVVYGTRAERPMMDVDLLVRAEDLAGTVRILTACGFRQAGPDAPDGGEVPFHVEANADMHELPPFRHPAFVQVDLHYALAPASRMGGIDHEGIFRRAVPLRVGGADALALAPEDLLLHLCIHAAVMDGFAVKLLSLIDLPMAADHHQARIDWAVFRDRARAWRAERPVLVTFALVERLFGWRPPEGALCELGTLPDDFDVLTVAERLVFLRGLRRRTAEIGWVDKVVRLKGRADPSTKAAILLRRMVPPRHEMAVLYGMPQESIRILMCYPRRLCYLAVRYLPVMLRALRRDPATIDLLEVGAQRNRLEDWLEGG